MTTVIRLGDEILVNTATFNSQLAPEITALSNGGLVVIWRDFSQGVGGATGDTSDSAVKAQVFAADGAPVGNEILVNTATDDDQYIPQVAALSNGGFVVTWSDFSLGVGGASGDASLNAIKAQVFATDGTPVGSEIRVNTATAGDQFDGHITALANGGFVVTWSDNSQGAGGATGDASGFAVKAQVFAANGTPVGSEILVNTATLGDQRYSAITALSSGGFVVTWNDNSQGAGGATGDASGFAVKAQVFAADGTAVGSEILVNTATANDQRFPDITALSNGGFVAIWRDFSLGAGGATGDASGSAVKAQVFAADGAPVGSEIRVNTATANDQWFPEITALSNGGFVVTWDDLSLGVGGASGDADGSAVKAQVFAANGTPVGSEIRVNTATAHAQEHSQVTALANGEFVVTWEDLSLGVGGATGDASDYAVKAQVFTADGAPVGSEILVNTATDAVQWRPKITALADGGFAVTWQDNSGNGVGGPGDDSGSAIKAQVFALNHAPVATASGGTTAASEQIAVAVDAGLTLSDIESTTLASATVAITGGFQSGEDVLAFSNDGVTMGNIAANYAAGTGILTLTSAGATATVAQWQAALRAVTYTDSSDTPNTANRTISFTVNDGIEAGTASSKPVSVAAVDDAPFARNDAFATPETTAFSGGSLFADNGAGPDDVDGGPPISVTAVNGVAAGVGSQITLASGALLTVNADGTFSYDPNHAFDYLAAPGSGASNTPGADQFTYTITGGTTATVTMTITGVDSNDLLEGTAGADTLSAGIGTDTLDGGAGNDTMIGGLGDDTYIVGSAGDTVTEAALTRCTRRS